MCNLNSVTSNQEVIRDRAGVMAESDSTGNMEPMPAVFPTMPRRSFAISAESGNWH